MKYSIILPYINRLSQLKETLYSFIKYRRNDFEIIIVEDCKTNDTEELIKLIRKAKYCLNNIEYIRYIGKNTNPAPLYNFGVDYASGQYLILSSPECLHKTNILAGLDEEFEKNANAYVVCACEKLNINDEIESWFQHSTHRNVLYHFCSALGRQQYIDIGGFDNDFGKGYCFDDDDFRIRALASLDLVVRDDLIVSHQWHSKGYISSREKKELWNRNKRLFEDKHGRYSKPPNPKKIER